MATFDNPYDNRVSYASNPLDRWLAKVYPINWETAVYILIFILAIFTRFYGLGDRTMSHDESLHTKFSWDLYANGNFQHTPLMHGPILFHATALNYFLFGDNDFTARIYPAVLGILMVMFPLLFRRWIGRWGAILASIMFLISPLILYYNRYIREDTPSIFYTLVMVYCTFMYLNGPMHLRRKARWLYIFSAAMLASLATKEVAFMYIAIFGSVLTLYWVVRMGQHFFSLPGKTLMYTLSIAFLVGGLAALFMYAVFSVLPWHINQPVPEDPLAAASLLRWTLAVIAGVLLLVGGTMLWAFRRRMARLPLLELLIVLSLVVALTALFIYIEERSFVQELDASQTSAENVPGTEGVEVAAQAYQTTPFYLLWGVCTVLSVIAIYSRMAGWWRRLHRFAELDIMIIMGTLVLPWLTPVVVKAMGASPMSPQQTAAAVQAAIPFIQFDLSVFWTQVALSFMPVLPALALSIILGVVWDWKRWLISAAIFYVLFVFFFTTVFTNINGLGSGMVGSLGYWLEQQAVRRGNQPQYYYTTLILPFYEFLPIIGSVLAMLAGLTSFWNYRRERLEAAEGIDPDDAYLLAINNGQGGGGTEEEVPSLGEVMAYEPEAGEKPKRRRLPPDKLKRLPVLIFISWWAIFNMIAYTLAGEKMPWLGTHMTTPMIFLAAWYFGRIIERIDAEKFWNRGWMYLGLVPVLIVALAQLAAAFVFGGSGGLEQAQLTRTFQWFGGLVIAGLVIYAIYRIMRYTGWAQFRRIAAVAVFIGLSLITFRSAWMASFINYDLATEFLVYAHGGPANKRVTEQLEDLSQRITDGYDLKFAYDYKISWPGAWYFRDFKNAVFLGESPSPRQLDDVAVVIVGDENRTSVETMLEDRYFRFDYIRMWWPMQDYFNLTAQRVVDAFDFSGATPQPAQIRKGMFDIWWNRDYQTYGEATGKNFNITEWPVSDRMYVFVRKDIAAQVWSLGVGEGTAVALQPQEINQCNANWQPLLANQVIGSQGNQAGQLNFPRQVAVGPDGKLYVAEEFNYRISVFNPDGTFAFSFGEQGAAPGQFERPNAVAVGPSGNIYVADTWNFRVQTFTPDGEYITSWGQRGEFGVAALAEPFDGFWGTRSIAVDSEERVYVADTGNKRVRVYNQDGLYLRDIGLGGSGNGQLDEPSGLAISSDGLLYVADTWNRRVAVFTLDGIPADRFTNAEGLTVNSFRVRGWADDLGNRPYVAVDSVRQLIYVTDPDAGRVLVYDTAGQCVGSFGQLSRESQDSSQFASVGGIALDPEGNVVVADAGSGRVLVFSPFVRPAGNEVAPSGVEATPEIIVPIEEVTAEVIVTVENEVTEEVIASAEVTLEIIPETTEIPAG